MEATGIQVNTDKLLHFAELLKVLLRLMHALCKSDSLAKHTLASLSMQLKIAQVETCAHKVFVLVYIIHV